MQLIDMLDELTPFCVLSNQATGFSFKNIDTALVANNIQRQASRCVQELGPSLNATVADFEIRILILGWPGHDIRSTFGEFHSSKTHATFMYYKLSCVL